jgi:hypothetical protein
MSHNVCGQSGVDGESGSTPLCGGTATSVITTPGKLTVVAPHTPKHTWSTATVSSMLKEDGVSPVTTLGDVVFEFSPDPVDTSKTFKPVLSEGQLNDFRIVACTYGMWNGHACFSNAGQVSNGVHAAYRTTVPGYKTVFVAYRVTGTPEASEPLFTIGNFKMHILYDDNTKAGCDDMYDMNTTMGIPLDINGTIGVMGIQFALVGSDTELAYIGTNDASVTHVQDLWFNDHTAAGPDNLIGFFLGAPYPASASPPMEWFEIQYYTTNTMTDLDMIKIRNELKARYT